MTTEKTDRTETAARVSRDETGMTGKVIYLACPYTHADHRVERQRAHDASKCAMNLIMRGTMVYSPRTYGQAIIDCALLFRGERFPGHWKAWKDLDTRALLWCDEVWVLALPGWRESEGVAEEIALAKEFEKPVLLVDQDGIILRGAV